jgi:hypothetical protein
MPVRVVLLAVVAACAGVQQRFPDDVQASLAHQAMRRLETDRFIIYYPEGRRAEVDRFVMRAGRCAEALRGDSILKPSFKLSVVMPDVPFNNAFVLPELAGYEEIAVIPTYATLDFTTEFGLPPDPGFIACHELTHYTHFEQIDGVWKFLNSIFGAVYSPQVGFDPWFDEGLATHYEAKLSPNLGRPRWPIFTGMFAAAYAGRHIEGGELNSLGREAVVGQHYLVGTMFVKFLTERYGDAKMWGAIQSEARSLTGLLMASAIKDGFGVSLGDLLDEFNAWCAKEFPVRALPPAQQQLATVGNDARYARGRDGTEAWVADDVDLPSRLTVRDRDGTTLVSLPLVEVLPPRTLIVGDPLLVSGLSITADGREVWLTVIDQGTTYQVPRLLRWRRGETKLTEVARELGPGGSIDPSGGTYYYCAVDGDRWSLAAYDTRTGARRSLVEMPPGGYVLAAQVSPDGKRVVADVWDGNAFVGWILDAATGARLADLRQADSPIWDASFTSDGRLLYLAAVDGRFQVFLDGTPITDVPYAALAPREANGTIRFLDREGWYWNLAEVRTAIVIPPTIVAPVPPVLEPAPVIAVHSDHPYSALERLFVPTLRAPTILVVSSGSPHYGVILGGGDPIGLRRWSLSGYAQPTENHVGHATHFGADAQYLNTMLAPWQILAEASFIDWADPLATSDPMTTLTEERHTRDASISLLRTWRETLTTGLAGVYTQDNDHPDGSPELVRHVAGPSVSISWVSGEATRYTDLRRALIVTTSDAYYPKQLSTFAGDIVDVGGALGVVLPLPLGRRHTMTVDVRGRALLSHDETGLLQVGGDTGLQTLASHSSIHEAPPEFDDSRFPPNLRFVESLRGYEDYAITTDRVTIGDASWRYPIIIDRGIASTLWILPASYLSQIDLELFGAAAYDRERDLHAAVGTAITLHLSLFRVPLLFTYQVARRVRDDDALTQLFGVAPDL